MFFNCSDSVVCFSTVPTVWYVFQLFRQSGMFFNCSDSMVCFSTVPTLWYVFQLFRQCGIFFNCSDSVVCCFSIYSISTLSIDSEMFNEDRCARTSVWTFWSIILFNIQILYSRAILLIEISSLVFTQRDFFSGVLSLRCWRTFQHFL